MLSRNLTYIVVRLLFFYFNILNINSVVVMITLKIDTSPSNKRKYAKRYHLSYLTRYGGEPNIFSLC